jgi:hypothetical protein
MTLSTHAEPASAPPPAPVPALQRLGTEVVNSERLLTELLASDGLTTHMREKLLAIQTNLGSVTTIAAEIGKTYKEPLVIERYDDHY